MGRTIELSALVDELETAVERRGLSYNRAALQLGVSPQRLSQWRRGARIEWTAELQQRLAAFLGVSPLEVLELDGLDVSDLPVQAANLASADRDMRRYLSLHGSALSGQACFRPGRPVRRRSAACV